MYSDRAIRSTVRYLRRQRLAKQYPTAAVSDVVQPIIVQLDRSVPARWRPYVQRGIEAWNLAFEAIGFRHAVVVRLPDEVQ